MESGWMDLFAASNRPKVPCITTTHLFYSCLSLKPPPPPCAVLPVFIIFIVCIYIYHIIYVKLTCLARILALLPLHMAVKPTVGTLARS